MQWNYLLRQDLRINPQFSKDKQDTSSRAWSFFLRVLRVICVLIASNTPIMCSWLVPTGAIIQNLFASLHTINACKCNLTLFADPMVVVWIFKNRSLLAPSRLHRTWVRLLPSRQPRIFERFGWVQRPGASLGPKLQGFPHLRWSSNCPVCRCKDSGCVSEMRSKLKSEAEKWVR